MKLILLFSLVILVSCGKKDYMPVRQDPAIMEYTQEFIEAAEQAGNYNAIDKISNISFRFKTLGSSSQGKIIGQCIIYQKTYFNGLKMETYEYGREILVDKNNWEYKNSEWRSQLITHELGHCSLNQDHRVGTVTFFGEKVPYPLSVMNPQHIEDKYVSKRAYYLEELFNPQIAHTYGAVSFPNASTIASFKSFFGFGNEEPEEHEHEDSDCHKVVNYDEYKE